MGYEQLNKFAGWKPGSDRAKVYVHLNNDDVNKAIRDRYSLNTSHDEPKDVECPFCNTVNQKGHSECRTCGRPLSQSKSEKQGKQEIFGTTVGTGGKRCLGQTRSTRPLMNHGVDQC